MTLILPNRYKQDSVGIGGGMGDIFLCIDTHLNRHVVLKLLKNGEDNRRLLDEIKALIKLRSKHVVQLYDIIKVKNGLVKKSALVLEHIDGNDLAFGSVPPGRDHLFTLWQIASGLVDIHNEGIIHRDIKPNNIRIDADGVIKIFDFGLARDSGAAAQTVSIIGTPLFMAPELWKSPSVSFDKSIDVYAFAVMSLCLVRATIPPELEQRPPKQIAPGTLKKILTELPSDATDILEKCLNVDPCLRPNMKEIEYILRRYLLRNKHRALLVLGNKTHEINSENTNGIISSGDTRSIGIHYDGLKFTVVSLTGEVSINNTPVKLNDELPKCCVITFGRRGDSRSFVTFDVSNPEVMP